MAQPDPSVWRMIAPGPLPPGEDWMPWLLSPPAYKQGRVVEIWRADMGNDTGYLQLENVSMAFNVAGLWWRAA